MSLKGHVYGRLTKDPEIKQSQNDTNYTQISIAVDNGKNCLNLFVLILYLF